MNNILPGKPPFAYAAFTCFCLLLTVAVHADAEDRADDLPTLDEPIAFAVHHQIERWVRQGETDERGQHSLKAADVMGVYVTLRDHGITIGSGEAIDSNLFAAATIATQRAIESARQSMDDARLRAATEGYAREASDEQEHAETQEPAWSDIAGRFQVDVQIGYGLEEVHLLPHDPADAVFAAFVPGYHGLSLQDTPQQPASRLWPATALAANMSPGNQITSLMSRQGLSREQLGELGRPGRAQLGRFRVWHIVRPVRDLPTLILTRGGVEIPLTVMDRTRLSVMSDEIADTLAHRVTSENITRGNYLPSANRYDPDIATQEHAMLSAWAMMHHHRADGRSGQIAYEKSMRVLNHLGLRDPDPAVALRPASMGLMLLAELDRPAEDQREAIIKNLVDAIVQRIDDRGILRQSDQTDAAQLPTTTQCILAYSLARAYTHLPAEQTGPWAEKFGMLLDRLWIRVMEKPSLTMLVWLIPAHYEAGPTMLEQEVAQQDWWPQRRELLRNTLDQLVSKQITRKPSFGPNDVLGGYQLVQLPHGAAPTPNWHSTQVLLMLAVALRQDTALPADMQNRWLMSAQLAARFVDQLRFKTANAYYCRSADDAVGGIRHAMYDNEMSTSSCAMGLLAIDQFRRTITTLSEPQESSAEPQAPLETP